jgi:tetratricopeptide (TPR) repeat protein
MLDVVDAPLKFACSGCGASLAYSATDRALKCEYCGTVTEIPSQEEGAPAQADEIVPLGVDITALTDVVYQHLASGDLTPDHLLEHASFVVKEQMYVPVYQFYGSYEAQWTASFGYDRQEHYTDYETRTENGRTRRVAVSKTKTVTDWRPVNGNDSGRFNVLAYGGSLLKASPLNVETLVEYKLGAESVAFDPSYVKGVANEEFTLAESDAYSLNAKEKVNSIIDSSVREHAQGDRQRDWHWTSSVNKQSATVLVPLCHAVYEFEGKQYHVWVNGAKGDRLVATALPVDAKRRQAVMWGYVPAALSFAAGALAVFKLDLPWGAPIVALLGAALFGVARKTALIAHSKKLRQATLASRRIAASNTAGMTDAQGQKALAASKRPERGFLSKALYGPIGVGAVTVAAVVLPFSRAMHSSSQYKDSSATTAEQSQPVTAQTVAAVPAPPPQVQASQVAPVADAAPASAADVATTSTASANPEVVPAATNDSPATPAANAQPAAQPTAVVDANAATAAVSSILGHVQANDWAAVDQAVDAIKASAPQIQQGDRRASRAANAEGLALLRSGNAAGAVQALERGVGADPADIEVMNNLGFALIQAGRAKDGVSLLCSLLMRVPQRSSAWGNLAEGLVADSHTAASALKVAVHYSANRDKTVAYLEQAANTHPNTQFRTVVQEVIRDMANVPPTAQAAVPSQRNDGQANRPAQGTDVGSVAQQMVLDGRACLTAKQYACALTNATNAMRIKPGYGDAVALKSQAEAGQAEAMRNIDIK